MYFENVLMIGIEKIPQGAAREAGRGAWFKFNGDVKCLSQCAIDEWVDDQVKGEWRPVRGAKVTGVHDISHYGGYDIRLGNSKLMQVFETSDRRRAVLLLCVSDLEFHLFLQQARMPAKAPKRTARSNGKGSRLNDGLRRAARTTAEIPH